MNGFGFQDQFMMGSMWFFLLGAVVETGRRLCQWIMERFNFQLSITAKFNEGDPTYEWIVLFLTQENVWRRSRNFAVNAKNSKRKWAVDEPELEGSVDYVPTYELPQLFRWRGYWVEVKRSTTGGSAGGQEQAGGGVIFISIYTFQMKALSELVEEARLRYKESSRPHVTVHMADTPTYGPTFVWSNVKQKPRRALSSIILPEGVVGSLIKDAQEFIDTESWYTDAGIPHRRGYLLHGPPGTGKTSTIYALAGELGLEIYSLSLASSFIDDSFLQKAASSMPKTSILLIEDIDCAFPSREDDDAPPNQLGLGMLSISGMGNRAKSAVTLSGLLNVLDGIGSEEGKLFFATTNYIDRLDPALIRPGRIDMRVEYHHATKEQASALYMRFFGRPESNIFDDTNEKAPRTLSEIADLAADFATHIPKHTFSTAELQGFLLPYKKNPAKAVTDSVEWVARELAARREKEEMDAEKKRKAKAQREAMGANSGLGGLSAMYGLGGLAGTSLMPGSPGMLTAPMTPTTPSPSYLDLQKIATTDDTPPAGIQLTIAEPIADIAEAIMDVA